MRVRRYLFLRLRSIPLLLIFLLTATAPVSPETDKSSRNREVPYTMGYVWNSSAEDLRGEALFFFSNSALGIADGLLIETPRGRRLVLTSHLAAQHGWGRVTLRDDSTGWWFEVTQEYDLRASGLDEFLREGSTWFVPGKGRTVTMRVRSSGGLSFEEEIAFESQPRGMHKAFVERMRSAGLTDELRSEIPVELTEAIAFLDAAFWRHDKRSVVDILAAITPEAVRTWGYTGLGWKEIEGGRSQRGVKISDPELLEFTSRFTSIDARQPLGTDQLEVLKRPEPEW